MEDVDAILVGHEIVHVVRRPEKRRSNSELGFDHTLCSVELQLLLFRGAAPGEVGVRKGVVARLVALGINPAHQPWIAQRVLPDDEERCRGLLRLEDVEHLGCASGDPARHRR